MAKLPRGPARDLSSGLNRTSKSSSTPDRGCDRDPTTAPQGAVTISINVGGRCDDCFVISELVDLDATAVLSATEELVAEQRERDVDELRLVLQWADLHSTDPGEGRVAGCRPADRLRRGGHAAGAGAVLGRARDRPPVPGLVATKHWRLMRWTCGTGCRWCGRRSRTYKLPAWVARKVAAMSRALVEGRGGAGRRRRRGCGGSVAGPDPRYRGGQGDRGRPRGPPCSAGRGRGEGRRPPLSRPRLAMRSTPSTVSRRACRVTLKLPPGTALGFDDTVEEVADALYDQLTEEERDQVTRGELQAKAIELLSNPAAAAAFLDQAQRPRRSADDDDPRGCRSRRSGPRPCMSSFPTSSSAAGSTGWRGWRASVRCCWSRSPSCSSTARSRCSR